MPKLSAKNGRTFIDVKDILELPDTDATFRKSESSPSYGFVILYPSDDKKREHIYYLLREEDKINANPEDYTIRWSDKHQTAFIVPLQGNEFKRD